MGIFSGLEKMGFKSMDKVDLFAEEKKDKAKVRKKEKDAKKSLQKVIYCMINQ